MAVAPGAPRGPVRDAVRDPAWDPVRDPVRVTAFDPAAVTDARLAPPAAGGPPHIWLLDAERHGPVTGPMAGGTLSPEERARAAALRVPADRDCYVTTHVGLRLLLGAYLGLPPRQVELTRLPCPLCAGPHGRPAVAGNPLHHSLSHSGRLGLLAFATTPVGADLETVPPPAAVEEARDVLHPRERAELDRLPPAARPPAFIRAWVRKEAYLKGLGTGLAGTPAGCYVGTGPSPATPAPGWLLTDVPVGPGASAAVAVSAPVSTPVTPPVPRTAPPPGPGAP